MGYNIKAFKPNPRGKHKQGYFQLTESTKYRGKGPCIFRSSWEKRFCEYCERSPEIVWWSSEAFPIRYFNPRDGKYHEYFPDFILRTRDGTVIIAEVKPKFQLAPPKVPKRKDPKTMSRYKRDYETYEVNMLKMAAAKALAVVKGAKYLLVTEDFFKPTVR